MALHQPGRAHAIPFKPALRCVRPLVNLNIIAQYRSYTPHTIAYMEDYLDQVHRMKDIFLQFQVTKHTQANVDRQRKEIRQQRSAMREGAVPSLRRPISDDDCAEENKLRIHMINAKSRFHFVKMHLLSHFCNQIRQFGNIPMYSTEIGELAHKRQIKEGCRQSNKNDAALKIMHSHGHQHAIRMRQLYLESLQDCDEGPSANILKHLGMATSTVSQLVIRRRILKGCPSFYQHLGSLT